MTAIIVGTDTSVQSVSREFHNQWNNAKWLSLRRLLHPSPAERPIEPHKQLSRAGG